MASVVRKVLIAFALCGCCHAADFMQKQTWWVTDKLGLTAPAPPPQKPVAVKQQGPSFQTVKDGVILSAAFGRKTAAICQQAATDEQQSCRRLAGERLFCALMRRHEDKYIGYVGAKEEFDKCNEVDIMQTAVEAAREERLEVDAAKA